MNSVKVVAEIGCNHMGDFNNAIQMISTLKNFCNVDVVKFQKRHKHEIENIKNSNLPHPNANNAFGSTYREHREFLEFSLEQHLELKKYAEKFGLVYSTSVWGIDSAKEISSLKPEFIKIPSSHNLNFPLLEYVCSEYQGIIHLSLGMTTKDEEFEIIDFFKRKNRNKDLILYACTSGYPVKFEEVYLNEITRLKETYSKDVREIGLSGHHLGIAVDVAAVALGATWIERHFTLDRTWKGTDQVASLEPDGMRRLVRDVGNISKSLDYKPKHLINTEKEMRDKLKSIKLIED